jgi:hypothetical protein
MSEAPLVADVFPELATELETLLKAQGEDALAKQVAGLRIIERCRCGDDFCATFYTIPKPNGSWGPGYRGFDLDAPSGMIILGALNEKIADIEILYRDEIRNKLNILIPLVKRK